MVLKNTLSEKTSQQELPDAGGIKKSGRVLLSMEKMDKLEERRSTQKILKLTQFTFTEC